MLNKLTITIGYDCYTDHMTQTRTYSPPSIEAAKILGGRIRLARQERRWTSEDLAERLGVTRNTVRKIERAAMTVALGTALEAAALLNVPLFDESSSVRGRELMRIQHTLSLLPARVDKLPDVDDDF